ncbi:hypothetical protein EBI01_07475 [Marinomonas rhizomae]|uniref:Uncharacterized protein n=1 Tax=Marinomonas rhizomae TaxID=491948 RepID=A0A366J9N9_9GAMM|nr:hypothetical protein [Marinomonas rhizomae]RBP83567.1 hypothetical protein DFP80_106216 [Marinomonas rhizomae]RNF74111.1 hypothetical protein EBI01_07475 [Marinomonas rhizomae]
MKIDICVESTDDKTLTWDSNLKDVPRVGDVISVRSTDTDPNGLDNYEVTRIEWGMQRKGSGEDLSLDQVWVYCKEIPLKDGEPVTSIKFSGF